MNLQLKLVIFSLFFLATNSLDNWETIGGNSARTSYVDAIGPESKNEILWEGSLPSPNICGLPILISNNKLVTTRAVDWENAPLVCHDIFTGDTLWTLDFKGGSHSTSIPIGFKNNVVYAANWFGGTVEDALYAINAENGEILWRSSGYNILGAYYIGVVFSKEGDIIHSTRDSVVKIDHKTGKLIWGIERHVFVIPDYNGLSMFNNTAYGWELGPSNEMMIVAIDVETGEKKYRIEIPSTGSPWGYAFGPLPVIDDNGVIYIHRANDNLVALEDNGDSLSIIWSDTIRYGGVTKPAIGPDGSVYFTHHNRIMRADSETGIIIDSSIIVCTDSIHPNEYFTIDGQGTVYFNNGSINGKLFSFIKDLKLNWIDSIHNIGFGGPALSKHGLLAIAGADNLLRVYKPVNLKAYQISTYLEQSQVSFLVYPQFVSFKYYSPRVYINETEKCSAVKLGARGVFV